MLFAPPEPPSPCQWLSSLLSLNPHCQGLLRYSPIAGLRPVSWPMDCRRHSQTSGKNNPRVSSNSLLRLATILAAERLEAGRAHRKKHLNNGLFLTVLTPQASPWTDWNPAKVLFFVQGMGNGNLERIKNTYAFNEIFSRSIFQYSSVFYFKEINLR